MAGVYVKSILKSVICSVIMHPVLVIVSLALAAALYIAVSSFTPPAAPTALAPVLPASIGEALSRATVGLRTEGMVLGERHYVGSYRGRKNTFYFYVVDVSQGDTSDEWTLAFTVDGSGQVVRIE